MAVRPTIFGGFIAPNIAREVPAAESTGAIGAPCCLVASPVPVYAGITVDLASLVFVYGVIMVLLWGLLLLLLPRLRCAHCQFLFHLVHRHHLLLDLVLLFADGFLGARVTAGKNFDERLILCVARWMVLNLVSGIASVVLAAAHISRDCADFSFEAGFLAPPYPCVFQREVASRECVPLFILRLEHSCID